MTIDLSPVTVFKCLGDDTRLRMLLLIVREQELCVCELTQVLAQPQPKISRHLALLRRAGLLLDRRQGQWVHYRLHPHLPRWVREVLQTSEAANRAWLDTEIRRLATLGDRPARAAACC